VPEPPTGRDLLEDAPVSGPMRLGPYGCAGVRAGG
jgi:hypothetical protein